MNRLIKRTAALMLSACMIFSFGTDALAITKQQAQSKIEKLQQERSGLKSRLSTLKAEKTDVESYIKELDAEMKTVIDDIEETNTRLEELNLQLAETELNLQEAIELSQIQYQALRLRIKKMYEEGNPTMLEVFTKSENITTALNSSEYIAQVSDYDNQLLQDYNETLKKIQEYKALLEEQKAEQEQIMAELEIKQEDLQTIIDQKNEELLKLGSDIHGVYDEITSTDAEIKNFQSIIKAIEAEERRKAEEEAKKQQQANQNKPSSSTTSSSSSSNSSSSSSSSSGVATSTKLRWPCAGGRLTSSYGPRVAPTAGASTFHKGIDIGASAGTAILAAQTGTVVTASYSSFRGYYVVVNHGNGMSTLYQHCSSISVSVGQKVSSGQKIAAVGSTGISSGPHLHFEVLVNGSNVNPSKYL